MKKLKTKALEATEQFYAESDYSKDLAFPVFNEKQYYARMGTGKRIFVQLMNELPIPLGVGLLTGVGVVALEVWLQNALPDATRTNFTMGILWAIISGLMVTFFVSNTWRPGRVEKFLTRSPNRIISRNMTTQLQKWIYNKYNFSFAGSQVKELLQNNSTIFEGDGFLYSLEEDKNGNYIRVIQSLPDLSREVRTLLTSS